MKKFPHGKYWNHVGMEDNNQNGYTETPCSSHEDTDTCNAFELNGIEYSWQCLGFAEKCGYDFSGSNPHLEWTHDENVSALENLKPGDIVRYYSKYPTKHAIFVTGIPGDTITFGDCNSDMHCKIRWGATTVKKSLVDGFLYVIRAPWKLY